MLFKFMQRWSKRLSRYPLKVENTGSNPVRCAQMSHPLDSGCAHTIDCFQTRPRMAPSFIGRTTVFQAVEESSILSGATKQNKMTHRLVSIVSVAVDCRREGFIVPSRNACNF